MTGKKRRTTRTDEQGEEEARFGSDAGLGRASGGRGKGGSTLPSEFSRERETHEERDGRGGGEEKEAEK